MSCRPLRFHLLIVIAILVSCAGIAHAQSIQYGKISGTVSDEQGAPVAGVTVDITSDALISGKRLTTTSENGSYIFLSLPIGTYKVSAALSGFKTLVHDHVQISAGQVAT